MRISRLVLKNFRNYRDQSWFPHPRLNIVSGNNAQGKTNLLEAIFFCTAGRSFRTSRDREVIAWNTEDCFAGAAVERLNSRPEISVSISGSGGTSFMLNGLKQGKNSIFNPGLSVSFTPADLDLIKGSPPERRKWLDLELGPFEVQYPYSLNKFEKVIGQRNNLLKNSGYQRKINDLIDPWNEQMFNYGSAIIFYRLRLLKLLYPHMKEVYSALTSGKEEVSYNYLSSIPLEKGMSREDLKRLYEENVRLKFSIEVGRQQSLFGPHRDDIVFMVNGADVRKYGSRGQQRSVVLAMKLSLMRMFYGEYGEYPVLLLDDVFLELDGQRQQGLLDLLRGEAQVFITSNRKIEGCMDGQASTYRVSGGKIYGEEE